MNNKISIEVNGYNFTATLADTQAARELVEMVGEAPLTLNLENYGDFEKVGPLGARLTQTDKQTTTKAGDIVLYNGSNLVIFYGSNSWAYTRLGKVDDLTDWAKALGTGDVTITISSAR